MNCDDWQELILDREGLDPAKQKELVQHMAVCADCRVWEKALAEGEDILTSELRAELNTPSLTQRIRLAVKRERRWVGAAPELLEALGWSALGVLAMAGLLLWSNWRGWHLWLAAASTLAASLAWAGRVFWNEQSRS